EDPRHTPGERTGGDDQAVRLNRRGADGFEFKGAVERTIGIQAHRAGVAGVEHLPVWQSQDLAGIDLGIGAAVERRIQGTVLVQAEDYTPRFSVRLIKVFAGQDFAVELQGQRGNIKTVA